MSHTIEELREKQALPLEVKIRLTEARVRAWERNKNSTQKKTGYDLYRETKSSNYDFEELEREIRNK